MRRAHRPARPRRFSGRPECQHLLRNQSQQSSMHGERCFVLAAFFHLYSSYRPLLQMPGYLPEEPLVACADEEDFLETCFLFRAERGCTHIEPLTDPEANSIEVRRGIGRQPVCVGMARGRRSISYQVTTNLGVDPGAGEYSGKKFWKRSCRSNGEEMTRVGIGGGSHPSRCHLAWREAELLTIATMQVGLNQERVQKKLAKLIHFLMVSRLGRRIGKGFRELIEEKCILANVELEVGLWERTIAQGYYEGMLKLALPERQYTLTQSFTQSLFCRLCCRRTGFQCHTNLHNRQAEEAQTCTRRKESDESS